MSELNPWLRLIRPPNCAMMALAVVVGAILQAGLAIPWSKIMLGIVTAISLTAASMVLNDYFDREIDAINQPDRPIPSGAVSPRGALYLAAALTIIGLSASAAVNLGCFLVALAATALAVAYNARMKRSGLPGNMMVSACVAIPFLYGALAAGDVGPAILIFMALAFLANTGREVTKGIADVEGDRRWGVRTIAVTRGTKAAAFVAAAFYLGAVALSPLPWLLDLVGPLYVPFVLVTDIGLLEASIAIVRRPQREDALRVKRRVLAWMLFGLLAFLAGRLSL